MEFRKEPYEKFIPIHAVLTFLAGFLYVKNGETHVYPLNHDIFTDCQDTSFTNFYVIFS